MAGSVTLAFGLYISIQFIVVPPMPTDYRCIMDCYLRQQPCTELPIPLRDARLGQASKNTTANLYDTFKPHSCLLCEATQSPAVLTTCTLNLSRTPT